MPPMSSPLPPSSLSSSKFFPNYPIFSHLETCSTFLHFFCSHLLVFLFHLPAKTFASGFFRFSLNFASSLFSSLTLPFPNLRPSSLKVSASLSSFSLPHPPPCFISSLFLCINLILSSPHPYLTSSSSVCTTLTNSVSHIHMKNGALTVSALIT